MATRNGNSVETDNWTIAWDPSGETLDLTHKHGKKHTRLCGDPHIMTDNSPPMDFPSPTCSFALDDGTLVVADAPAANQPLHDVHVFTSDGQAIHLGQAQSFDDLFGTVFVQQADGAFFAATSRDLGGANPVTKQFKDA
jgi:hypothetical protein